MINSLIILKFKSDLFAYSYSASHIQTLKKNTCFVKCSIYNLQSFLIYKKFKFVLNKFVYYTSLYMVASLFI